MVLDTPYLFFGHCAYSIFRNTEGIKPQTYLFTDLFQEIYIQFCHRLGVVNDPLFLELSTLAVADELTDLGDLLRRGQRCGR